jgi:glutaredoxin
MSSDNTLGFFNKIPSLNHVKDASVHVTVYVSENCSRCAVLKSKLSAAGVVFVEKNLGDTEVLADLVMRDVSVFYVPLLEVDGNFIEDITSLLQ